MELLALSSSTDPAASRKTLWKRAPKFEFIDGTEAEELDTIHILNGPAEGVKYKYGVISFGGINEEGDLVDGKTPSINFTYDLVEGCEVEVDQVIIDEMGKVLSVLLDAKFGGNEDAEPVDGENDSEQSGSE
jgi:hypothetical protein